MTSFHYLGAAAEEQVKGVDGKLYPLSELHIKSTDGRAIESGDRVLLTESGLYEVQFDLMGDVVGVKAVPATCLDGPFKFPDLTVLGARSDTYFSIDAKPDSLTTSVEIDGKLTPISDIPVLTLPAAAPAAPAGTNPKDLIGLTKVNPSLVPSAAILHEAAAMMDGAQKYGPFNWRENKVLMMIYLAAALRHIYQLIDGENYDPISMVHHAGHARACLGIILDALETGNLVDDRPLRGAAGEMIRAFDQADKLSNRK